MLKRLAIVLVLMGSLVFAAGASASARDSNGDRLPDRWEKKHGLSLKVKQTYRDQDKDGFKNLAEWRAHSDPRDTDTDEDGVTDDDENAGTVTAINGASVTITLFAGGALLTGNVTADTEVECDGATASSAGDDPSGEDESDEDESGDDESDEDESDEDHGNHESDEDSDDVACPPGALAVGAKVKEAELKATSTGPVWEEIELR